MIVKGDNVMQINNWMSWVDGVDLVGLTDPSLAQPNVIVHVARMVHTPIGNAASGMIFWQPDISTAPLVVGFVSSSKEAGAYFGPRIFAGTPFENAPVLEANIDIQISPTSASAKVEVVNHVFEITLSQLTPAVLINREPLVTAPFYQQGMEQYPVFMTLKVNGNVIPVTIPPVGISGGPAAVYSACGIYSR
jgi:hypothetical protein